MDNQRGYARIITVIYFLAIILTVAIIFLIGLQFTRPSHLWISLFALFIAESAVYGLNMHRNSSQSHPDGLISGYMAYATVAGIYLIAVVAAIALSLIIVISTFSYALIHIILLSAGGIISGLIAMFSRNVIEQEHKMPEQVIWVKHMGLTLLGIKQDLESWKHPESEQLKKGLEELEEKVRFSDPVSIPPLAAAEQQLLGLARNLANGVRNLAHASDVAVEVERIHAQMRDMASQMTIRNQQLLLHKS